LKQLFQANLIEKVKNIGGILNATAPFYSHFNQQYKSLAISVRCLYKSNYKKKTLNIKCTQYFETTIIERVLANGEIEQTVVKKRPDTKKKKINPVFLLFVHGFGIAQVKSEYDI